MIRPMLANPYKLADADELVWDYFSLWQGSMLQDDRHEDARSPEPEKGDKRFADGVGAALPVRLHQTVLPDRRAPHPRFGRQCVEGLDESRARSTFHAPVHRRAVAVEFRADQPGSLPRDGQDPRPEPQKGFNNLLHDIERATASCASDDRPSAFEMGKNVATTPGKVIFQNEMIQLIQYEPATKEQYKRPLLIIPPWINKYYILDLRRRTRFIKWVDQGQYTVFVIRGSTRTPPGAGQELRGLPDRRHAGRARRRLRPDGREGNQRAGYCLGGTLLSLHHGLHVAAKEGQSASPPPPS